MDSLKEFANIPFRVRGSLMLTFAREYFPERASAQGSLCPVRPLGLLPGVCSLQVGGFFCRKNAVFLSRTLKNCGVLPLGLVAGGAWASRFMHIYGASAHFA